MTASQRLAEVIYRQSQPQAGQPEAASSEGSDEVVDAEVVDEGEERSA
jgi:hypothetical protein